MIYNLSGNLSDLNYIKHKKQYDFVKKLFELIQLKISDDILPADYDNFTTNHKKKLRIFCSQQKLKIVGSGTDNVQVFFNQELIASWKVFNLKKNKNKFELKIQTWTSFEE